MKRMKRILAFLAVLTLLCPLSASAEIQFTLVKQYMPSIRAVNGTGYVIMESKQDNTKGVFTTDGKEVVPYQYGTLNYLSNGFFEAFNQAEGVNYKAFVCAERNWASPFKYGAFKAYNKRWIAAYVLEPGKEEDFDQKIGQDFYEWVKIDLYYFGTETKDDYRIASLSRSQYKQADIHGNDYIAILDRAEQITLYNNRFEKQDYELTKVAEDIYGVFNFMMINKLTNQMVLDGFTSVREQDTAAGMKLIGTRYHWTGKQMSGVFEIDGTQLMPVEYTVSTVTDDYAVIADVMTGKKGLYSLKTRQVLVPCAYDNIIQNNISVDPFVSNGYVCVEVGDQRGYVKAGSGEVTCEAKYDKTKVTTVGCSMYYKTDKGYTLIAADGKVNQVAVDEIVNTRGDGYLLIAKKDGFFGVMDWHGKEVLPFYHNKNIVITDDSSAIIRISTGTQIETMTRK